MTQFALNKRLLRYEPLEDRRLLVADIDSDLVAFWKLDEASLGEPVVDASGFGNDGVHTNMAPPSGPSSEVVIDEGTGSRSLQFDGVDDAVTMAGSPSLDFSGGSFTLSVWIKSAVTDDGWHGVMGYQDGGVETRAPSLWLFQQNRIHGGFGDGASWQSFTTDPVLLPDAWNHIATTYDGAAYRVYANGVEVRAQTHYTGQTPVATAGYWLGRVDNHYAGLIDHARAYTRALTSEDVTALYNEREATPPPPPDEPGLVAHWRLDEQVLGEPASEETGLAPAGSPLNMTLPQGPSENVAVVDGADQPRSMSFDGVDDYIAVPASPALDFSGGQFTQSVWILSNVPDEEYYGVLGHQTTVERRAPGIWVKDFNRIHAGFGDGSTWGAVLTGPVLTAGAWNHVVTTYDGNLFRVYVGGTLVHSVTYLAGRTPYPDTELHIGRVDGYFRGLVDDVRLYDRALSEDEVTQLHEATQIKEGTIQLETNEVSADEGDGTAVVRLVRTGGADTTAVVDYTTIADTARAGSDYVETTGSLTFAPGQVAAHVEVPILEDPHGEGTEAFGFAIDRVDGAALGTVRTATVRILDNDLPPGTGTGLAGEYFELEDMTALEFTRLDASIDFDWGAGVPDASLDDDGFSVRWTGFVEPHFSETYTFLTTTDDGVRLWIDDVLLVDRFVEQTATTHSGTIALLANHRYAIRMEYFDGDGPASARLEWQSASQAREVVPTARLYNATSNEPIVSFSDDAYQVDESVGTANITILRSGSTVGDVSVRFTTTPGTALPDSDYLSVDTTITIPDGATSATVAVPLLDDAVAESIETLTVALSDIIGGTLGLQSTAELRIIDDDPGEFQLETVAEGILLPVNLAFMPDGRMYVAAKNGTVHVVDGGVVAPTPFLDIRSQVNHAGDRGLLGIALHPNFPNTPYMYLSIAYDPPETAGHTGLAGPDGEGNRVSRVLRVEADPATSYATAIPGSEVVVLGTNSVWENITAPDQDGTNNVDLPSSCGSDGTLQDCIPIDSRSHMLGEVGFGPDGMLYVASGDGTSFGRVDPRTVRVQNLDSLSGKILRIDPITGEGLPDNPFFDGDPNSNRSKVYSYGLRNPFRFTFHPQSGEMFLGDVGWTSWEEINTGRGANFGWPYFEGGDGEPLRTGGYEDLPEAQEFYASGQETEPAIYARHHSEGASVIVLGDIYDHIAFPSIYHGALFYGDTEEGIVDAVMFDEAGEVDSILRFAENVFGIVDIQVGPDGNLYVVNIINGTIERFVPVATASATAGQDSSLEFLESGSNPTVAFATPADLGRTGTGTLRWDSLRGIRGAASLDTSASSGPLARDRALEEAYGVERRGDQSERIPVWAVANRALPTEIDRLPLERWLKQRTGKLSLQIDLSSKFTQLAARDEALAIR